MTPVGTRTIDVGGLSEGRLGAAVVVSVADPALATVMTRAISAALEGAVGAFSAATPRVLRLRTRRRFEQLGATRIAGAMVVVRVTAKNARRLPDLVDAVRAAEPDGVQLVWDGEMPSRALVERHVFTVLERARATPGGPPVVLAKSDEPTFALRVLAESRGAADRARRNESRP